MRTRRLFLNRLGAEHDPEDAVVVIDVLRSFTTAAYAFTAGASTIYPVDTIAGAFRLLRHLPDAVTTGAIGGGDPIPGFDFGNSPCALLGSNFSGRPIIQTTAAGVCGLNRFRKARTLFAGSLVLGRATAQALLELALLHFGLQWRDCFAACISDGTWQEPLGLLLWVETEPLSGKEKAAGMGCAREESLGEEILFAVFAKLLFTSGRR